MTTTTSSPKRLILRVVLRDVSPMVIRLISVADQLDLPGLHEAVQAVLGWNGDLSYIVRIHGQELRGHHRRDRNKPLSEFRLHRQERFYYASDLVNLWEWDVRVLDISDGIAGDDASVCLGGRGAAPPQHCGGPTGYRLMLKHQNEGAGMYEPEQVETVIRALAAADPDAPASTWETFRWAICEGRKNIEQRLDASGPLRPHAFSLREANARLAERVDRGRFQ